MGLRRNESDCFAAGFYRLALFENIGVTITGGELLVKCLQVDGERKFELCCWSTPLGRFCSHPSSWLCSGKKQIVAAFFNCTLQPLCSVQDLRCSKWNGSVTR